MLLLAIAAGAALAAHAQRLVPASAAVLCAIAKHEDLYIREWIDHHLALGVDRVHVYDNSDANVLRRLPNEYPGGRVHVTHWPGEVRQVEAYRDFMDRHKGQPVWVGFLDVDEFVILRTHRDIKSFLREHCGFGAVSLNWLMFGSGGQTRYRPEPVRKRFLRRGAQPNKHVKSFAYLPCVARVDNPHYPAMVWGAWRRDTDGMTILGAFNPDGPTDVAVVHHYFCKSVEEYAVKRRRTRAAGWGEKSFFEHDRNDVFDDSALAYI